MENYFKSLVAILNYNGSEDTLACIDSFYKYENKEKFCVVVWDNCSEEKEKKMLQAEIAKKKLSYLVCTSKEYEMADIALYDLVLVLSEENLGFAKGNNSIIKNKKNFKYFVLLNNDTEFVENTTYNLINYMDNNREVSAVTSVIYYYNQSKVWNAGGRAFGGTRKYFTEDFVNRKIKDGETVQTVDFITGCYLVVRPEVIKEEGIFTEKFFFGEEDYEFCLRMKREHRILQVLLKEKMYHKVGASIKRNVVSNDMYRRTFIHHLNRFVNMKNFYGSVHWNIWRSFSSIYIYLIMVYLQKMSCKKAGQYVRVLNRQAKMREDVNKEFFLSVMNGEVI